MVIRRWRALTRQLPPPSFASTSAATAQISRTCYALRPTGSGLRDDSAAPTTAERTSGRQWGENVAASGENRWPEMGRNRWPLTRRVAHRTRALLRQPRAARTAGPGARARPSAPSCGDGLGGFRARPSLRIAGVKGSGTGVRVTTCTQAAALAADFHGDLQLVNWDGALLCRQHGCSRDTRPG